MASEDGTAPTGSFSTLAVLFGFLLAITAALVVASFPAGIYTVFIGQLSTKFNWLSLSTPYLYIGPVFETLPFRTSVGASFLLLTSIYAAMFVLSTRQGSSPATALVRSTKEGISHVFESRFLLIMISSAFLVFTVSVVDNLVSSAGVPIGSVSGDPMALLLGFTTAPLVEELGFRVMTIGLLAAAISLGMPWKELLRVLWRPSAAFKGGSFKSRNGIAVFSMLVVSAALFGIAHVEAGWEVGKFFEATYGGFVLGYLYIKYGFHVAVLAHWTVDYFGSIFAFFGQSAFGVPWDSSTVEFPIQTIVDYDLLIFGVASFLVVSYVGVKALTSKKSPPTAEAIGSS